jgi:hypothetical protein
MRCGSPNGYTLVHFDGARYRTEFRAARRPASHQMTITAPEAVVETDRGLIEIVVNVFHGAGGDLVAARITPGAGAQRSPSEWTALVFDPQIDPTYAATHEREEALPEELVENWGLPDPRESHRVWSGSVPIGGLPAGTHVLEVRHRDLYGAERIERRTFRVIDASRGF